MQTKQPIEFITSWFKKLAFYPPPTRIRVSEIANAFSSFFLPCIFNFLLMCCSYTSYSQSFPPPFTSTGDSTTRGMYVSCGDMVMDELKANTNVYDSINNLTHTSATLNTWKLINYCKMHYISYIALYSLAQKHSATNNDPIVGNSAYNLTVRRFLQVAHDNGIKVGIVITNKEFLEVQASYGTFVTSPFYWVVPTAPWDSTCYNSNTARHGQANFLDNNFGEQAPPDSLLNPTDSIYGSLELSELLKGVMRVYQYSYWAKNFIPLGCTNCNEEEESQERNAPMVTPPKKYLFDYMSLEYEYWSKATYSTLDTTVFPNPTKAKKAWNNFSEIANAMLYVSSHMCGLTKNELELRIIPPKIFPLTNTQPVTPWDLSAQDMPKAQAQVDFISKYFHRILLSDYFTHLFSPISKTASTYTRFANIPSSLNAGDYNLIMPVFSAATAGVQKHCFDTLRYDSNNNPDTVDNTYLGPYLDTVPGANMSAVENNYLIAIDYAAAFQNSPAWQFGPCEDFNNGTAITTCSIDTTHTKTVGFMWFNYSYLRDIHRSHVEYSRMQSNEAIQLSFSNETNLLHIKIPDISEKASIRKLQVIDVYGRELNHYQVSMPNQYFSLNELANGVYICKLINGNQVKSISVTIIK